MSVDVRESFLLNAKEIYNVVVTVDMRYILNFFDLHV